MRLFALGKRFGLVLAVVILGSSLGAVAAIASDKSDETQELDQKVEEWIGQQKEQSKKESGQNEVEEGNRTFYELSYDRATDEQREQLEAIFSDHSLGSIGEWRRDVLITLGDLPADTPTLTAQDAAELYSSVPYDALENAYNTIAGAPDWVGGSGIHRSVYFLNDERTEAIYLLLGDVRHVVLNEDGTRTRLPVGTQELPPEPGPTVGASTDNTVRSEPDPTLEPSTHNTVRSEPDPTVGG